MGWWASLFFFSLCLARKPVALEKRERRIDPSVTLIFFSLAQDCNLPLSPFIFFRCLSQLCLQTQFFSFNSSPSLTLNEVQHILLNSLDYCDCHSTRRNRPPTPSLHLHVQGKDNHITVLYFDTDVPIPSGSWWIPCSTIFSMDFFKSKYISSGSLVYILIFVYVERRVFVMI